MKKAILTGAKKKHFRPLRLPLWDPVSSWRWLMDKHARSQISRKHWPSTCTKQLVSDARWHSHNLAWGYQGVQLCPVFQAAGPDYPKIFNQTGSLGACPSLDESIMRALSRSPDFSYASAPMFHILHILSLLAFFLAICHRCQGSLGGVMWFGPWIFASENSSWWTALLWQTVCLYTDAWGICTIMSSLNVHDDMVLTDAPSVGSLRRDLSNKRFQGQQLQDQGMLTKIKTLPQFNMFVFCMWSIL